MRTLGPMLVLAGVVLAACGGDPSPPDGPADGSLDARHAADAPPGPPPDAWRGVDARPPDGPPPPPVCADHAGSQMDCIAQPGCVWDSECLSGCYAPDADGAAALEAACPDFCSGVHPPSPAECPAPCQWIDCTCGDRCKFSWQTCLDVC